MYEYDNKKPLMPMERPREGLQMGWLTGVGRQASEDQGPPIPGAAGKDGLLASILRRRLGMGTGVKPPPVAMPPVNPTPVEPGIPHPDSLEYGRYRRNAL